MALSTSGKREHGVPFPYIQTKENMAKMKFRIDMEEIEQISISFENAASDYRDQFLELAQKVNDLVAEYNEAVMEYNEFIDGAHSDLQEYVTQIDDMVCAIRSKYESRSDKWQMSTEGEQVGRWVNELELNQPEDIQQMEELSELYEIDESEFEDMVNSVTLTSINDNCYSEPELDDEEE